MTVDCFKLTIHMVSSLDGFIAKKDNSASWFETTDHYEQGITMEENESSKFLESIDCYVMGSRTYEHALELSETYGWPYGDIPTIVLSQRKFPAARPNIEMYAGDLNQWVSERLKPNYMRVWLVGGAKLFKSFIQLNLVDEIRQSILPIILGEGLPFYDHIASELLLHLTEVKAYKTGMVDLCYDIKK